MAAEHVRSCFAKEDFSAEFNKQYDREIYRRMGEEFKLSHRMQQMANYPFILNRIVRKANRSAYWQQFMTDALSNVEVKKYFLDPRFYIQLLLQ